jgi:hypothetical protein
VVKVHYFVASGYGQISSVHDSITLSPYDTMAERRVSVGFGG